jgi:hypothetical protein
MGPSLSILRFYPKKTLINGCDKLCCQHCEKCQFEYTFSSLQTLNINMQLGKLYVDLATILENNISETFTNSRTIYKVPQIGDEIVY